MLEFKKKTRAHKWRNYAVYGLLTLSQLSKTGIFIVVRANFPVKEKNLKIQENLKILYAYTFPPNVAIATNFIFSLCYTLLRFKNYKSEFTGG